MPRGVGGSATLVRRVFDVARDKGLVALCARVAQRVMARTYESSEMVYVARTLADLPTRYGVKGRFRVEELDLEAMKAARYPLFADRLSLAPEVFAQGCRVFVGFDEGQAVGGMLVGQRCRHITDQYQCALEVREKDIVSFDVFVLPAYRKGKAVGVIKEAVMLKLKNEGYTRMLGVIDVRNRGSLSLARHFGFQEVKRVRNLRVGWWRFQREIRPGPDGAVPLARPRRGEGERSYVHAP